MDHIIVYEKQWALSDFIRELKKFNTAYRKGEPLISDRQYNSLTKILKEQYPEHEWFSQIEPSLVPEERKIKLPIKMKSLNKVLSIDEFHSWVKACGLRGAHKLVCMPKFDGGSLLVTEATQQGYSRGGEENEGQICDIHIIKAGISTNEKYQYTFGEFVISVDSWDKNFKGQINPKSGLPYKAPRNVAVGMLNADTPPKKITESTFFRFGISGWSPEYATFTEQIKDICDTYNQPHLYLSVEVKDVTHELLQSLYNQWSKIFGIDGIVLYVDNLELSEKIGRNQSSGNPLYAIAYKGGFEEEVETEVLGANCKVSKNGYLRPTVEIEPVGLSNSTISNPTGNNMRFVFDNKIAQGAIVKIKRSGEVIPKILETITPASDYSIRLMRKQFSECPNCKTPTRWNDTNTDIMCPNTSCSGILLAKLFHFFTTIGCDGLGEEIFKKLFSSGFDTVAKILNMTFSDIVSIEGMGVSTAQLIIENNKKIQEGVDLDNLMHASDCFSGIGKKKSFTLLDKFGVSSITHLRNMHLSWQPKDRTALTKTEQSFYNGLPLFLGFVQKNNIKAKDVSLNIHVNKDGKCSGFKVCFTGVRDIDLEETIIAGGGEISSGVSKKTTHLIVKDVALASSKFDKAKSLGVPILTIEEFRNNNL